MHLLARLTLLQPIESLPPPLAPPLPAKPVTTSRLPGSLELAGVGYRSNVEKKGFIRLDRDIESTAATCL
jgi:hypothetical protein